MFWKRIGPSDPARLKSLGQQADVNATTYVSGLSAREKRALAASLNDLIQKRIDGINYAEGRRTTITVIAGVLVAGGTALLPNVFEKIPWPWLYWSLIVLASAWIAGGLLVWLIYGRQTNFNYPFIGVDNPKKWFYRNALSDHTKFNVPLLAKLNQQKYDSAAEAYVTQWNDFQTVQGPLLSHSDDQLVQDLKQLYLLHVNEKYKNDFLTSLRKLLNYVVFSSFALATLTATAISLWGGTSPEHWYEYSVVKRVGVSSEWKPVDRIPGVNASGGAYMLSLKVQNLGKKDFTVQDLIGQTVTGGHLKLRVVSGPATLIVKPNTSANRLYIVTTPENRAENVVRIYVPL